MGQRQFNVNVYSKRSDWAVYQGPALTTDIDEHMERLEESSRRQRPVESYGLQVSEVKDLFHVPYDLSSLTPMDPFWIQQPLSL